MKAAPAVSSEQDGARSGALSGAGSTALPSGRRIKLRLLVVVSHPIQYQAPLYRQLAESDQVVLRVAFLTDFGMTDSFDPGFGRRLAYDVSLTGGYEHTFLTTGRVKHPSQWRPPPPALVKLLSPQRCDAVVVHGYSSAASWATCGLARARGIPYLMRGETRLETEQARPAWRRQLKRMTLGPLLRQAGACLAIGSSNREFYAAYGVGPNCIVNAPYSVDTEAFAAAGARGRARREELLGGIGLDPRLPTVCLAAKLQPYKRPLDVVQAMARIGVPANLLIIGDGPLRSEVGTALKGLPSARCLGFVNQSEIGQWYGASEVIVLASSREPWGLAINEAMATGAVPVVSSAVGCGSDLVRAGHGAIFPVGDVTALASALEEVLSVVSQPGSLGAARARSQAISAELSVGATARGYEEAVALACKINP